MEILTTKNLSEQQFRQINQMWNEQYPVKLKDRFALLLDGVENYTHYLIEKNEQIIAWAVAFEKENETRFSIIVTNEHKGNGLGSLLLKRLKRDLGEFYGWVIDHDEDLLHNDEMYISPLNFYLKNGCQIMAHNRIESVMIRAVKIKFAAKVFAQTERFVLREIVPADVEGLFLLDSDPEVHRYLGNKPVSNRAQIREVISFIRQQYIDNGIGRWAIIDKKTNDFIGWTGLKFVTDLTNHQQNYYDLGYRISRKYWGQGIATETAIASLDYAFTELNLEELYACANCENIGSNKILQKIGLNFIETFLYDEMPCNWYKITKQGYQERKLGIAKRD